MISEKVILFSRQYLSPERDLLFLHGTASMFIVRDSALLSLFFR